MDFVCGNLEFNETFGSWAVNGATDVMTIGGRRREIFHTCWDERG